MTATRNDCPTVALLRAGIDPGTVGARILDHYAQADSDTRQAGRDWYPLARSEAAAMAAESGHTVAQCAAVISHLSPRQLWAANLKCAWSLIRTGRAACLGGPQDRARAALASADPLSTFGGPKTACFARNIIGDPDAVTIDGWQLKVCDVTITQLGRKGVYDALAAIHAGIARALGEEPRALQAITWIVARGAVA